MTTTTTVARTGSQTMTVDTRTPPNQSLYIQNLPEKLQKQDLRRALYMLFSTYGTVLDIVALKTKKMRGQAHVLFRDVQSATQAMRACQGFEFFGREMRISYSKNRSDTLAKLTGTFNQPESAQKPAQAQPPSSFPAPPGLLPPIPGQTTPAGNAPPSTLPGPPTSLPPPPSSSAKVNGEGSGLKTPEVPAVNAASPQGVKRKVEDSDEEEGPMEEDEEEDEGEMEMSDED